MKTNQTATELRMTVRPVWVVGYSPPTRESLLRYYKGLFDWGGPLNVYAEIIGRTGCCTRSEMRSLYQEIRLYRRKRRAGERVNKSRAR